MTFTLVLIEDEERDQLTDLLVEIGGGDFEVEALSPPPDLILDEVFDVDGDLFLVDYVLDTVQPDCSVAPYLGMTFAARLREERPAYPIALLTSSNLPAWTAARRTARVGGTFDDILYKDTGLKADPAATHDKLISLAGGYLTLRNSADRSVSSLLKLLKTDKDGRENALGALPPSDGWKEFEAAHWIRSVLLRFPGVVYNEAHAATALGISLEGFKEPAVQELLRPAEYQGPFSEEQPRWWRHTLFDIANRLRATTERSLGLREGFRLAAADELGIELGPSVDEESDTAPADTVCYLLQIPVRIETSLPYQPDARPAVMEQARISFRAIRERNDVEEMYVDAISRARLEEIRMAG